MKAIVLASDDLLRSSAHVNAVIAEYAAVNAGDVAMAKAIKNEPGSIMCSSASDILQIAAHIRKRGTKAIALACTSNHVLLFSSISACCSLSCWSRTSFCIFSPDQCISHCMRIDKDNVDAVQMWRSAMISSLLHKQRGRDWWQAIPDSLPEKLTWHGRQRV